MAVIAAFAVIPLEARQKQKWENQPYKYELSVGLSSIFDAESYPMGFGTGWSDSALDNMYMDEYGPLYTSGGYSAEFALNFRRWFSLGFDLSTSAVWHRTYSNVTGEYGTKGGAMVNVMPVARFFWVRSRVVKMYSSIGMGVGFTAYDGKFNLHGTCCIVPVGMRIGTKVYGLMELGGGANVNMQGFKAGIGVRF